jgi:hypothetical protein
VSAGGWGLSDGAVVGVVVVGVVVVAAVVGVVAAVVVVGAMVLGVVVVGATVVGVGGSSTSSAGTVGFPLQSRPSPGRYTAKNVSVVTVPSEKVRSRVVVTRRHLFCARLVMPRSLTSTFLVEYMDTVMDVGVYSVHTSTP